MTCREARRGQRSLARDVNRPRARRIVRQLQVRSTSKRREPVRRRGITHVKSPTNTAGSNMAGYQQSAACSSDESSGTSPIAPGRCQARMAGPPPLPCNRRARGRLDAWWNSGPGVGSVLEPHRAQPNRRRGGRANVATRCADGSSPGPAKLLASSTAFGRGMPVGSVVGTGVSMKGPTSAQKFLVSPSTPCHAIIKSLLVDGSVIVAPPVGCSNS